MDESRELRQRRTRLRRQDGTADSRLIAGGVTLGILLVATFIAALIVSGALSGIGAGAASIAISGGSQTLGPDSDDEGDGSNDVTETTTTEPASAPSAEPGVLYSLGDSGDAIRELQARLRQLQWYQTDVTGEFDDVTAQAVQGFQAKRGLEPTGEVDEETWSRLVEMTTTPTEDEKNNELTAGPAILGPGDDGEQVRELQARLKQLGWFEYDVTGTYGPITATAVEGFQTKRGIAATGEVDQNTWDLLVDMTSEPTDAELNNDPADPPSTPSGLPEECMTGRVLCIDKTDRVVRWVTDGTVDVTLNVRFGSDPSPTREGTFEVYWKARKYKVQGTDMPYALVFDNGQAVHYSADFDDNGYNGSADGSVNVADESAMDSLFDIVERGDAVVIYRS